MSYIIVFLFILALLIQGCYTIWKINQHLHMLQLNSYFNQRYLAWLQKKKSTLFRFKELEPLISLVGVLLPGPLIILLIFILSYLRLFFTRATAPAKKPLVFTPRAVRLLTVNLIFLCLTDAILIFSWWQFGDSWFWLLIGSLVIYNFLVPIFMLLANFLLLPVERLIQAWYLQDASRYLYTMPNLKVVGITGSFGKTTTKYVLTEILRRRFHVLKTPGSYNTTMGVTKVVRSELKPIHEIFVVEMSAKKRGDIQEICDLVKPQYGLITAIGEQHLETFKSLENIKQTKGELIAALPTIGMAFFNLDDPGCQELAKLCKCRKVSYGIESPDLDYRAFNLTLNESGSNFTVNCAKTNHQTIFQTKLLGKANIYNILGAIAVAGEFGIELVEMVYPIRQLAAIPHRLELKRFRDEIIFIDDAFNSNPVGSKIALEVLNTISGKRKIIITPGMIELGTKEQEYNRLFGEAIAAVCDYVILVGKQQTLAIQEGLRAKQYPENQLLVALDFSEAKRHLEQILQKGDRVLFENDLPDNYCEN